jgi:predicted transcriptional regulator
MRIIRQKITIWNISKPVKKDINEELQWFGSSLGLFGIRDKDKSCFRIFIELLKSAKKNKALTSDEIAFKTGLSRGTVIHHLNKLMEAGIVISEKNVYLLRGGNLEAIMEEVQKDMNRSLEDLRHIANQIDKEMGL